MINCRISKPWQVVIEYDQIEDRLVLRVREHTHGSIAFRDDAEGYCGGAVEQDKDGYTIRCREEPAIVEVAREIARMSELPEVPE